MGLTLDPDVSVAAPGKQLVEQLVEQPVAARNLSRALPGAPHEESSIPTLAVPGDATALQVRATHLSRALPEAPHEESPIATLAVPGDATALQVRTTEPTPVSEHARLQDPLFRGDSLANTAPATATLITSAAAIPFATPSVNGGSNTSPTTLPNPLERNIARQLTQQLSAPLASLTNTGEQRKGAVDKTLIIRLTPPELGTVRIEISQRNGELIIRMHAEDPAVRQAIERMLPNLRTDLRQVDSPLQHITVESSSSDRNSSDRNSGDRNSDRNTDDRGAWQGQQQRHERAFDGSGQSSRREGERPVFSLTGMPASEPIAIVPRSRSLGGRSSTMGVDALA